MHSHATESKKPLDIRVAMLGAGRMGGILLQAFLNSNVFRPENICATVQHAERSQQLAAEWGVSVTSDNLEAAAKSDLILLGVPSGKILEVVRQIRPALTVQRILLSFAGSVRTNTIEQAAGMDLAVIRAMPNTPTMVGCGATALCRGKFVSATQLALAEQIFGSVGRVVLVDEQQMDAVTGLSASGTAFLYIILESLAEAGAQMGLSLDVATQLAAQTMLGAAAMVLETGSHPALLQDAVTTPGGCTLEGIRELEEGDLRATLIKAVMRAAQCAKGPALD